MILEFDEQIPGEYDRAIESLHEIKHANRMRNHALVTQTLKESQRVALLDTKLLPFKLAWARIEEDFMRNCAYTETDKKGNVHQCQEKVYKYLLCPEHEGQQTLREGKEIIEFEPEFCTDEELS